MPVAIAVLPDKIPGIWSEETDRQLVSRLAALPDAPPLTSPGAAQQWLSSLPAPSGWYESIEQAKAAADQAGQKL